SRIAEIEAGPGNQATAINAAYQERITLAEQARNIELQAAKEVKDWRDQEYAIARANAAFDKEAADARIEQELKILDLRKQQRDTARSISGSFFDAAVNRRLPDFFRQQATSIGRTIFENATQDFAQKLRLPVTNDPNSRIGKLF